MKTTRRLISTSLVLCASLSAFCSVGLLADCKDPNVPNAGVLIEAGTPIEQGICQDIEIYTGSPLAGSICASVPEIALIVATIAAAREKNGGPPSTAKLQTLPGTTYQASDDEIALGIAAVLNQRRARLLVEAGLQ